MSRTVYPAWLLIALALVAFGYAAAITVLNLQHIAAMPVETREPVDSLDDIVPSLSIVEHAVQSSETRESSNKGLERRDIRVLYGDRAFAKSENVWVNTRLARNDSDRYLRRFRAGVLNFEDQVDSHGVATGRAFLMEVHQDFREQGDKPRVNLWLFPAQDSPDIAFEFPNAVDYAHNLQIDDALVDPAWRALFADNHARLVRAFPALAACLIGLAALGSLIFVLWREQPWAVTATTVTFVLPVVSAAPFLTAFGWLPLIAPIVLGFVITMGIVCAVEQRVLPRVREKLRTSLLRDVVSALLIPATALIVGTTLVVSFTSVSVIEWQGLGRASPGDIFMESLIRPAIGLLAGGTGSSVILAAGYLLLQLRFRARSEDISST